MEMPRIQWNESFSVGVPEIDLQHRQWIGLINKLHDELMGLGNEKSFSIRSCLEAMVEYGKYHLTFEEDLLEEAGYRFLEQHRYEHELFRERLDELIRAEQKGQTLLNSEVMNMMTNWLQNHILQSDMDYKELLGSRSVTR
jgi:hemerythrin